MATYFVTRHKGAVAWAHHQGIEAEPIEHIDVKTIRPGDHVLGTLPVSAVAEICARGGRYSHLELNVPREMRGKELSAQDMESFGAKLVEFHVTSVVP